MPRPQMPKKPDPLLEKAQRQNVSNAKADANTARKTTQRVEKALRTKP